MFSPLIWTLIGILLAIQLILLVLAIRDWLQQPKTMPDRMLWLVIILLINLIGPIIYFLAAPRSEQDDNQQERPKDQGWEEY